MDHSTWQLARPATRPCVDKGIAKLTLDEVGLILEATAVDTSRKYKI